MAESFVVDFSYMLDELITKSVRQSESKAKAKPKSDIVNKYKTLYEASVKIENLEQRRDVLKKQIAAFNASLANIDEQIEELNKLFSN